MGDKDNDIIKVDKKVQRDYPLIGSIGTYLNFELEEKSNTELEIEAMKKKQKAKDI